MIGLYALKPWCTRRLTPILNTAVTHNVSPDISPLPGWWLPARQVSS
jgi:CDP-diacylglycerol--glycerol-3-phosphate 3-phosphatidyltransferase